MGLKKAILALASFLLLIIVGSHLVSNKIGDRKDGPAKGTTAASESEAASEAQLDDADFTDTSDSIRVAINTTGYTSLYHKKVTMSGTTDYTVVKDGVSKTYKKGKKITYQSGNKKGSFQEVVIKPLSDTGRIQVTSIERGSKTPEYRGSVHIYAKDDGLVVVNELTMEQYLYGVVPSEMPANYGEEALKVQAICARGYAMLQKSSGRFTKYEADVDDSVNCQVYMNTVEDARCNEAVRATKGMVLYYEGHIADTCFFSTSSGHTTDYTDVWYEQEEDTNPAYLTGSFQGDEDFTLDLSKEENFQKFINGKLKADAYEKDEDWYRWSIVTTKKALSESIAKANSEYQIGTLKKLTVLERGAGGVVKKLKADGTKGSVVIEKQYEIRRALAPLETDVKAQNGKTIPGMSMLPSGYFYLTSKNQKVTIKGGGYGHGVGMSQNGVKCMAEGGKKMKEILSHYYPGTEVTTVY